MPRHVNKLIVAAAVAVVTVSALLFYSWSREGTTDPYRFVSTVAGLKGEFGEPFGIAVKGPDVYVSDGQHGKILLVHGEVVSVFANGLDTPSGIAFDKNGALLVADSGTHTVRSIDKNGRVSIPKRLRDYSEVESEVVLIGLYERIELWSPSRWEAYLSRLEERHEMALGKILSIL